jgi:2-amino-4-hydroxy-6-hydroxymethyldihydropteridine diphosphokinase
MDSKKDLYLLTGSNLGDRVFMLNTALLHLKVCFGDASNVSSIYETAAWGLENQDAFLNQVLVFHSALKPKIVLQKILDVEQKMGRERNQKWGTRIIDIDILYYGDTIFHDSELEIPHPFIAQRRFTLLPLLEVAPNLIHPVFGKTTSELLNLCSDKLSVKQFTVGS